MKKVYKNSAVRLKNYILPIIVIFITALFCSPLANTQNYHIVSYILLFVVSILATVFGTGPVLLAASLSALVWNYFFIPPHYTFHIDKTEDILMFGMFFLIALVNGVLTTRVRRQEKLAREREERTNILFQLTKELSRSNGIDQVLAVTLQNISNHFATDYFIILQDGQGSLNKYGSLPDKKTLTGDEYNIARWVFKNLKKAGKFSDSLPQTDYTFYLLKGTRLNPGVIAIKQEEFFVEGEELFWDTYTAQISNALEREFLGVLAQKASFLDESDRFYKTLFNSISHEFRIPVATIMGASDTLLSSPNAVNIREALYDEIFKASLRLNRLIENLLNMSRLESGHISVRLDWCDINDLVNKVISDLKNELASFNLKVNIQEDMPLIKIDFGLMEQVLYNLLFNSCEYAPDFSEIRMDVLYVSGEMLIYVSDNGPGFPEHTLQDVFKKFFRVERSKVGGLGLGLSIVKGFVEAHKGSVMVENRNSGGARFTIRIPSADPEFKKLQFED